MNVLNTVSRWIDILNEWVGRGVAWVTLVLVVVIFIDVFMRYLFNTSFVFTQELEWHLFAFILLIGAGYTLLHDGHVRVDILYQRLGLKGQAWINFWGHFFSDSGMPYGDDHFLEIRGKFLYDMEGSPDPGGIPLRFIVKGCIPAGFLLLLIQGISLGIHSLMQILGIETAKEEKS